MIEPYKALTFGIGLVSGIVEAQQAHVIFAYLLPFDKEARSCNTCLYRVIDKDHECSNVETSYDY